MGAPFITPQDLSDLLGRDVLTDNGALFAVESACEIVRVIAEQNFDPVFGDTVTLDGTGTDCLLLPELPATAAGTVLVAGGTVTDYVLADNGRLIRKASPAGTAGTADWWWWSDWYWGWPYVPVGPSGYIGSFNQMPPGPVWPMGRQNVQVVYDHGGTVPQPVRMVALSLAARIVVQGPTVAETVGPVNVRYAGAAMDLTKGEAAILHKYRPIR